MTTFADLIARLAGDGGAWSVDLPQAWAQGRTAYGGLTAALCVEAARRAHPDAPPLRSAQFVFAGPAGGRLSTRTSVVRRGKSTTIIEAALDGEAGPATRALLTFGADRESRVGHQRITHLPAPTPESCEPYFAGGMGPAFAVNFEARLADGFRPLAGGEPRFAVWARHRDATDVHPETAFIGLADMPPPAAMAVFPAPGPISTITWSVDFVAPPAALDWVLIVAQSDAAAQGYSQQSSSFWGPEGQLIALARQTVAVFV